MPDSYINPDSSAFITIATAAQLLKYSERTIYRWIEEGKLKGYRIGNFNQFRIKKTELVALMKPDEAI